MSHLLQVLPEYYMLSIDRAVTVRRSSAFQNYWPSCTDLSDCFPRVWHDCRHRWLVFGRRQSFGQRCRSRRIFGGAKDIRTVLGVPQHSYNMIHTSFRRTSARCNVPCWLQQLGCEWNAKLQNWDRCSKLLSQLDFGNVLAQSSILFLSYQKPNFKYYQKYQIFCLQAFGNLVEENIMYQPLKSICREKVCHIKVFRTDLGKYGQNILCTTKDCQLLH